MTREGPDLTEVLAAAPSPTSTMVALYPRPEEAALLAVEGGEEPETLHVTLCYLGDTDDDGHEAVLVAARELAAAFAPLAGDELAAWEGPLEPAAVPAKRPARPAPKARPTRRRPR